MSGRNRFKKFLEERNKLYDEEAEDEKLDQQYLLKQEKKGVARAVDSNLESIRKSLARIEELKGKPKVAKIQRIVPKEESESESEEEKPKKKTKKEYKESNLMKGRSDLKKVGDKYAVETEMAIKKGLDKTVKKALKKSIIQEAEEKIKGSGIRKKIELDIESSSDEEEKPKKGRGRPKKAEIKNYGSVLEHLVGHIKDPKEKIDPMDYKQSIQMIKAIKKEKSKK